MSYPRTILFGERPDITDTIPAGQIALWSNSGALKIRIGTTTSTLDIGISREEIEDLLANSFGDSASINFTYNDNNNNFTASLATSLLNKINSALQNGSNISLLNNDSQFETPTQLNTRDNNNRNRSNHSGSQLASTISNFSSTVRATILTGLSTASSLAVTASDSVLSAIGKLQSQVNILNARVFETQFQDFQDLNQVNFSGAFSNVRSFTTQVNPVGRYRIAVQIQFEPAAGATNDFFELRVDGNPISLLFENEPKDTGNDVRNVIELKGFHAQAISGSFNIQVWGGNEGGTTELNGVIAEVWRVA